jgi:hypothetical protein
MIHVSNSLIIGRGQNNTGFTETRPKFWAPMFRAIWGAHLDPEKGLEVINIADFAPEQGKYATYDSVSSAERDMITFFIGNDSSKRARVVAAFNACYPEGLKVVIQKHVEEDLKHEQSRLELRKAAKVAHPSFLDAGIDETSALNLMNKGYGTVAECSNVPAMDLVEAGLAPSQAAMLVDLAQRTRAANIEAEKTTTLQAVSASVDAKFKK